MHVVIKACCCSTSSDNTDTFCRCVTCIEQQNNPEKLVNQPWMLLNHPE